MLDRLGTNPTQLTGLLSFVAAATACVIAALRSTWPDARVWQVLGFINGIFLIEIIFGLRHRIHDYLVAMLKAEGEYGQRRGMQEFVIIGLATIALICVMLLLFSRRLAGNVRIAGGLTIALLALFAIETVSLHSLDAVLYGSIGPVALIGWLWAIATAGICWTALTVKG
jgi:uncharacterized membrane protein